MKKVNFRMIRRPGKYQAGVTMVELGLVLLVAAVIGIGVMNGFGNNTSAAQAGQLADDLNSLVGKVKSAYSGQYGSVTNAKLDTGGFFKGYTSLTNTSGTVTTNAGGGLVTVVPGTVTVANDSVKYTITQLPDNACLPLVTALSKSVTTLNVNSNAVKAAGTAPDPSKVTCSNDANTITFQAQ